MFLRNHKMVDYFPSPDVRTQLVELLGNIYCVRYSFIQLSELEQCRVKKAQGFNTTEQDLNMSPLSRV